MSSSFAYCCYLPYALKFRMQFVQAAVNVLHFLSSSIARGCRFLQALAVFHNFLLQSSYSVVSCLQANDFTFKGVDLFRLAFDGCVQCCKRINRLALCRLQRLYRRDQAVEIPAKTTKSLLQDFGNGRRIWRITNKPTVVVVMRSTAWLYGLWLGRLS